MPSQRSQPRKIGIFTVLAKLGEGAASYLYAVQHPKTKQVSALKFVEKKGEKSQRFLDQVEQEYAIGSKLDHIAIRKIRKIIKHRKLLKVTALSMLMELIDATTLDQQLPRNHAQAVDVFLQNCTRACTHAMVVVLCTLISNLTMCSLLKLVK